MSDDGLALSAVRVLLSEVISEDPTRDGLRDTPRRVVKALREMTEGYEMKPAEILSTTFDEPHDEMIVLRGVRFTSLCEHHVLPFTGSATVGYIPNGGGKIVGLSKLARLVECYAKRLQVQERMTDQITAALLEHLEPRGAGAVVRASHACMAVRGARQPDAEMVTSSLHGLLREDPAARAEFMALARPQGV